MDSCAAANPDRELVECYAREMACAGGLCESVSYGWALYAFLADPTEFRARVRSVNPALRADTDGGDDVSREDTSCADDDDDDDDEPAVASLLQPALKTVASSNNTGIPPFSLARRGYTSKYRGVVWDTQKLKWRAKITSLELFLGFFKLEDDAARAHDQYAKDNKLNISLNANGDGVLVVREPGSVYQGVRVIELSGGTTKFNAFVHEDADGGYKQIYIGKFHDEIEAAIAHDAFVRTMPPPTARSRPVNFLTFDEQIKFKLPRPFLIEIVRKENKSQLRLEKATITECRTDTSAHAEEYSACLLYFLEFDGDSTPSCWDSLILADPSSCVFLHRKTKVTTTKKVAGAKDPKSKRRPTARPQASREPGWAGLGWMRFKI